MEPRRFRQQPVQSENLHTRIVRLQPQFGAALRRHIGDAWREGEWRYLEPLVADAAHETADPAEVPAFEPEAPHKPAAPAEVPAFKLFVACGESQGGDILTEGAGCNRARGRPPMT